MAKLENYTLDSKRDLSDLYPTDWGPSMTQQQFKDESDVNNIIKAYVRTGQLPNNLNDLEPQFADVSNFTDYKASLDFVRATRARFDALPDEIRSRFVSPEAFADYFADPAHMQEAVNLGLASASYVPAFVPKAPVKAASEAPPGGAKKEPTGGEGA